MLRLTISYHDDTREPVAVATVGTMRWYWQPDTPDSHASLNLQGAIYYAGPHGEACRELLLRERRHWEAKRKQREALAEIVRLSEDAVGGYAADLDAAAEKEGAK